MIHLLLHCLEVQSRLALAMAPFTLIGYVEFKIVMFAALRVSFAVIVMLRLLFTVARDVSVLLLDIVRVY